MRCIVRFFKRWFCKEVAPTIIKGGSMELVKVESSTINRIGYDLATHALLVEFKNYSVYVYDGVAEEVYTDFLSSESKGKFFASDIKSKYEYFKLEAELFPVGSHTSFTTIADSLTTLGV
jgi:hypothetical protein